MWPGSLLPSYPTLAPGRMAVTSESAKANCDAQTSLMHCWWSIHMGMGPAVRALSRSMGVTSSKDSQFVPYALFMRATSRYSRWTKRRNASMHVSL